MTLAEQLETKADMINMGERIQWGSDQEIMREAAAYIRQLTGIVRAQHKALEVANNRVNFLAHCTGTQRHIDANDERYKPIFEKTLALSAPIVKGV